MIAQQNGPVLLVGHSYGGAVITQAGNHPDVVGLAYIAAFAPDEGESPGGITQQHVPEAAPHLEPDSDGYLWLKAGKFHESFCQDLTSDEGLLMAVTQKHRSAERSETESVGLRGPTNPPGTRSRVKTE
jgi:pimeloyl-ACP methyl ester carboxylesterase